MNESVQPVQEYILYLGAFQIVSLIAVIAYSIRKGGVREVIENLFLWALFTFAIVNLSLPPVDTDDEISASILFVAFGACRIAKHMARKAEIAKTEKD